MQKHGGLICGTDACMDLIQRKKVKLIIIASDAADRTKKNFKMLCEKKKIPICFFANQEELSKAIGKNNKVVIGIKNNNFKEQIVKLINGGEIIG